MTSKKLIAPFYERLSLVLIGLLSLGFLVVQGKEILDPLVFGFLFAILLLPVSAFLEQKLKFPRSMSSLVSILLLVAFVYGILYLVGTQISKLSSDWPMLQKQVGQSTRNVAEWIQGLTHISLINQENY